MFKRIIEEYIREGIIEVKDKKRLKKELKDTNLDKTIILTKETLFNNRSQELEIVTQEDTDTGQVYNLALKNVKEDNVIANINLK